MIEDGGEARLFHGMARARPPYDATRSSPATRRWPRHTTLVLWPNLKLTGRAGRAKYLRKGGPSVMVVEAKITVLTFNEKISTIWPRMEFFVRIWPFFYHANVPGVCVAWETTRSMTFGPNVSSKSLSVSVWDETTWARGKHHGPLCLAVSHAMQTAGMLVWQKNQIMKHFQNEVKSC